MIVKTPHEASGIPTAEANLQGIKATRQIVSMLADQVFADASRLAAEVNLIKREVRHLVQAVLDLGEGNVAEGTVRAFQAGMLDVPFAPSVHNAGKLMPIRDNEGAIRVLDFARVPMDPEVVTFHRDRIEARARAEGRQPSYHMLIDDIYAVSKGRLVGRPR